MNLTALIAMVYTLLARSADDDRLTPAMIAQFINDDYISLAEEVRFLPRRVVLATVPPAQATATVTVITTPTPNDTVTIAGNVYTFVATLTTPSVAGEVLIDSTVLANNAVNLCNAVNATPGNPYVTATVSGAVVTVTARIPGTLGNGLALATNNTSAFTLSGSQFAGGVDTLFLYPQDFCALQSVRYYNEELNYRLIEELDSEYPNWWTYPIDTTVPYYGTPRHFYRQGQFIGFYPPVPNHAPVILEGYCVPSYLVNEGATYTVDGVSYPSDVPAFPPQYHMLLVHGAIQRILASKLFDIDNAQALLQYATAQRDDLVNRFAASRISPTERTY